MLILDFDGNLTDVEAEGQPFVDGYLAEVAKLLGQDIDAVRPRAADLYRQIASDVSVGWTYGGEIMAPATVDPYLRMSAIGRTLLRELDIPDVVIDRLTDLLFRFNYRLTRDAFKDGTFSLLMGTWERELNARIVTNSDQQAVIGKIDRLLGGIDGTDSALAWWKARVIGNARKYDPKAKPEVGAVWDGQPDREHFDGFPRPTVLKRPHYFKVLNDLRASSPGMSWDQVLVVGDILELDLALPLALGCHVGLMANEHTPSWELAFVAQHPRARVLRDPIEIVPFYDEIQAKLA